MAPPTIIKVVLVPSLPGEASSSGGGGGGGAAPAGEARRVDAPNARVVQSVCACSVGGSVLIAVGGDVGLQVWDESGSGLLFFWPLPEYTASPSAPPPPSSGFVRGLAFNAAAADGPCYAHLCAGTSGSDIAVFEITAAAAGSRGGGAARNPPSICLAARLAGVHDGGSAVTALGSAFQSRRGGALCEGGEGGGELISADDGGRVVVWARRAAGGGGGGDYVAAATLEDGGAAAAGVGVRRGLVVVARVDGAVRIYGLRDGRLRCEIVAHSRWLSALDLHPRRDAFATAAEDCTVSAWTLPIGDGAGGGGGGGGAGAAAAAAAGAVLLAPPEPLLSAAAVNSVLTGVAWCGEGCDDLAAAVFDADELLIWRGAGWAGGGARRP
ncbi:hypothetical protein Rsub_04099 [Raphidocelis subcapitata]|uniref:WD repeat-containing protein 54 beta-propeller domain-containing protein n=1 Tax=Raphidocelis subcapitata TaxID=307507 RepID=A0A2V0NVK0_9CHLO|nr:hypothetical protein Rsub_04099 [Raphidocelis subcapitata]|eukprot:GBF91359.1 hypothetical protein Rsub_04099 [Raphidocelis subcapitata]